MLVILEEDEIPNQPIPLFCLVQNPAGVNYVAENNVDVEQNFPKLGQSFPQLVQTLPPLTQNLQPSGQNLHPLGQNLGLSVPCLGPDLPPPPPLVRHGDVSTSTLIAQEAGENKSESEDEYEEMDFDDSIADPDYNPAINDEEFDRESRASSDSMEEIDIMGTGSVAGNSSDGITVSESEHNPTESADDVVNPQRGSEKLLTSQPSGENSRGKLNNKKHACFFCKKLYPNIARHLTNKHSKEHEVEKILVMQKKSKLRRKAWEELVNKGDFSHNSYVISKGDGMIIPKFRSKTANENVRGLIPCQSCRGFYKKTHLWKHKKRCSGQKSTVLHSNPVQAGKLLMPFRHTSEKFHESVIVFMKDDEIRRTVESDRVILCYGKRMFESNNHEVKNKSYISCKMRELGRLLLAGKKIDSDIKSVLDFMKGLKFWDALIAAVKIVAEYDEERHQFGFPSLAERLLHSMKGIAEIVYFDSLKDGNIENRSISQTFLDLYALKWKKALGSIAYPSPSENEDKEPQLLSLVEDVKQLNNYLIMKSRCLCDKIEENPREYYPALVKVCLAQVMLFNGKRNREVERMTVEGYHAAKLGGNVDNVVICSLTKFEQELMKSHLRVGIKATRHRRRMLVLLTEEMVSCLNKVLKNRKAAGISNKNLVFARPGSRKYSYRGCDVLREFANNCNLRQQDCITSTRFRKQVAIQVQVLNLKDNNQALLVSFQGHDIRVNRQIHSLTESTLQVAKISKLLHCLNNGTISRYKDCDFEDIELESGEIVQDDSSDDETGEELSDVELSKGTKKKNSFTDSERKSVTAGFKNEIRIGKVPRKQDVIDFVKKNPCFSKYPWTKVKFAVHNMISARKREWINKV